MTINRATVQVAVALLLLSRLILADDNADAANERIPVAGTELEAHWKVDCSAVLNRLQAQVQATHGPDCTIATDLRRDIQLCAFIYQPPGGQARHRCPDYAGSLQALEPASPPKSCEQSLASIRRMLACKPSAP